MVDLNTFRNIIKIFHLFSAFAFMSGIFYLPRIFVYHTTVSSDSDAAKLFCTMERRLFKYIMTPALIFLCITGGILAHEVIESYPNKIWLYVKDCCVLLLITFYLMCYKYMRNFNNNSNNKSERFFRAFNEIPTVLLLVILSMVFLQPF